MVDLPPPASLPPSPPPVEWRQKPIGIVSMVFCAGVIVYLLVNGADTRLNETMATMAWMVGGSIVLGILGLPLLAMRSQNQVSTAYYRAAAAATPPPAVSSTKVVSPD